MSATVQTALVTEQDEVSEARTATLSTAYMGDATWDDGVADRAHMRELHRQARLASQGIGQAFLLAQRQDKATNDLVWSELQGALFASIVVCRVLDPRGEVRKHSGLSKRQAQGHAVERARRLRVLLDVEDDVPVFAQLRTVRDSLEHFDERLDAMLATRPNALTDLHISSGAMLLTTDGFAPGEPHAYSLRTYWPEGGWLIFDGHELDLIRLDDGLVNLQARISAMPKEEPAAGVHVTHGPWRTVQPMSAEDAQRRCQAWLDMRQQSGHGLG